VGLPLAPETIAHPTEADALVLDITNGGGWGLCEIGQRETHTTQLPVFALHGDGRVFFLRSIHDGGTCPSSLLTTVLSEDGMQQILRRAWEAGLFLGDRSYRRYVEDAATTVVSINANDQMLTTSSYPGPWSEGDSGDYVMDAGTVEEIETLGAFLRTTLAFETWMDPADIAAPVEDWIPTQAKLVVNLDSYFATDSSYAAASETWPLADEMATFGEYSPLGSGLRCGVLSDSALVPFFGNWIETQYCDPSACYRTYLRPLLPSDPVEACDHEV